MFSIPKNSGKNPWLVKNEGALLKIIDREVFVLIESIPSDEKDPQGSNAKETALHYLSEIYQYLFIDKRTFDIEFIMALARRLKDYLMQLNNPSLNPAIEQIRIFITQAQTHPVSLSVFDSLNRSITNLFSSNPQVISPEIYAHILSYLDPMLDRETIAALHCTSRLFAKAAFIPQTAHMQFASYHSLKNANLNITIGITCLLKNNILYVAGKNTLDVFGFEHAALEPFVFFNQDNRKPLKFFLYPTHLFVLCKNTKTNKNELYALGQNRFGRLGLDIAEDKIVSQPQLISFPEDNDSPIDVTGGGDCTVVLCENGKIYTFGLTYLNRFSKSNTPELISLPEEQASKIETTFFTSPYDFSGLRNINVLAQCKSGELYHLYQHAYSIRTLPIKIDHEKITSITKGVYAYYLLCQSGVLYAYTYYGNKQNARRLIPITITTKQADDKIIDVKDSGDKLFIICQSGRIYTNKNNITKHKLYVIHPTLLLTLPNNKPIRQLLLTSDATYILYRDGELYAYGNNQHEKLGIPINETDHKPFQSKPKKVILPVNEVPYQLTALTNALGIILYCKSGNIYALGNPCDEGILWFSIENSTSIAKKLKLPVDRKLALKPKPTIINSVSQDIELKDLARPQKRS